MLSPAGAKGSLVLLGRQTAWPCASEHSFQIHLLLSKTYQFTSPSLLSEIMLRMSPRCQASSKSQMLAWRRVTCLCKCSAFSWLYSFCALKLKNVAYNTRNRVKALCTGVWGKSSQENRLEGPLGVGRLDLAASCPTLCKAGGHLPGDTMCLTLCSTPQAPPAGFYTLKMQKLLLRSWGQGWESALG